MHVSKIIRSLRRQKELSQKELAKMCGVSPDTYRRWEHGSQEPRLTQIITLAAALDANLEELLISDGKS